MPGPGSGKSRLSLILTSPSRHMPEMSDSTTDMGAIDSSAATNTTGASVISGGLWNSLNQTLPQGFALVISVAAARFLGPWTSPNSVWPSRSSSACPESTVGRRALLLPEDNCAPQVGRSATSLRGAHTDTFPDVPNAAFDQLN